MQAIVRNTERLRVSYRFTQTMPNYQYNDYKKYIWVVTQDFDFSSRGKIEQHLDIEFFGVTSTISSDAQKESLYINISMLVFNILSLFFQITELSQVYNMYKEVLHEV